MKIRFVFQAVLSITILFYLGCAGTPGSAQSPLSPPDTRIKVLVITGGHGFKAPAFFKLFQDNHEILYTAAAQGKSAAAYNRRDLLSYDVIVLYDFQRELTDAQKATFLSLFDHGVGVVVLHHALLSYQTWPEYERIAGGKYLLDDETVDGKVTPASTYKGNVDIPIKIVAPDHPITSGLHDWVLHDELYRGVLMRPDVTVLLTTEGFPVAWTRIERQSRVVGIIVGHGPAYKDPSFQRLLAQSIRWVAKRS